MFSSLFRYIRGYLKIRIIGYSPERFLNICKNKNILVWDLKAVQSDYEMYMTLPNFKKLKPILKKTSTKASIIKRYGLPFFLHKHRKRKLFLIGMLLAILQIYVLSFFIWKIDYIGNQTLTNETISEYLASIHVSHGMLKNKVNCDDIAKKIRNNFQEVIWVSVALNGSKLEIHIKERDQVIIEQHADEEPCDIISNKTGIVREIITQKGTPNVKIGDSVNIDDLLVSGRIPILNDAKEVVSYQYVNAKANIVLETKCSYKDVINKEYQIKKYTNKKKSIKYIKFGNYIMQFSLGKIKFKKYDQSTQEKQLKLSESFYLPFYWGSKTLHEYHLTKREYTDTELEILLKENFEQYYNNLKENNVTILDYNINIRHTETGAVCEGELTLLEEVGIERKIIDLSTVPMLE